MRNGISLPRLCGLTARLKTRLYRVLERRDERADQLPAEDRLFLDLEGCGRIVGQPAMGRDVEASRTLLRSCFHGKGSFLPIDFRSDRVNRGIPTAMIDKEAGGYRINPSRYFAVSAAEGRSEGAILARRQVHEAAPRLANRVIVPDRFRNRIGHPSRSKPLGVHAPLDRPVGGARNLA